MAAKNEPGAGANRWSRAYSFTELCRMRVLSSDSSEFLGHVRDVVLVQQGDAIAKLLAVRKPREGSSFLLPWACVTRVEAESIVVQAAGTLATLESGTGLPFTVRRDLLGRRVVDRESIPVGRIQDVVFVLDERGLAADELVVSQSLALARLAKFRLAPRRAHLVSWTDVEPHFLESRHLRVVLRVSRVQLDGQRAGRQI